MERLLLLDAVCGAAGTTGSFRTDQEDVLDRYLLGELAELIDAVTASMDAYDLYGACEQVQGFLDTLTNWFIRRSRDRFWEGDQGAIDTLHTALVLFTRVAAPLLPMVAEQVPLGLPVKEVFTIKIGRRLKTFHEILN